MARPIIKGTEGAKLKACDRRYVERSKVDAMRVKVLVDDIAADVDRAAFGFSALVTTPDITILFDTGPDGELLLRAMEEEGIAPEDLDMVIVSHDHKDHAGGLSRLLYEVPRLPVSAPMASAPDIARRLPREAVVLGERGPRALAPHVRTTGTLPGDIPEQALVMSTSNGLVVVTGCGHPGLGMLLAAIDGNVTTLFGGFHDLSDDDVGFTSLEGMVVCHCTPSKRILAHTHDWIVLGQVGTELEFEPPSELTGTV